MEEVAVGILIGLGKEALTQKCIPKTSESFSISGRAITESDVCC